MIVKDPIAVYGAVLSTLVAIWNVFLFITDRGKLKVHCYIADVIGVGEVLERNVLVYSLTNVGRKPIYVTTIGGAFKRKNNESQYFLVSTRQQLPMRLEPGQNLTEYTPDISILKRDRIRSLHAIDSLGHSYKVKQRVLNRLLNDISRISKQV